MSSFYGAECALDAITVPCKASLPPADKLPIMKTFFQRLHATAFALPFLVFASSGIGRADVQHITSGISVAPGSTASLLWDVDSNGTDDFYFEYFAGQNARDMNAPNTDPSTAFPVGHATGALIAFDSTDPISLGRVDNLPAGFLVGSTLPSGYAYLNEMENLIEPGLGELRGFTLNEPGYVGFSFQRDIGGTMTTLYGWARFTVTEGSPGDVFGITISEWAYEDTGAALSVPVPEPGSTGALLSLAGLGAFRRWRRRVCAERS
ncbi:MAG: hypothetical protein RL215_833 [Planctomycetota bacterium]|jgi:hypothetical protein